ncbi:hypothetical protein TRVA0_004S02586 [Trichomonascus vanleenenianus]|uniref:uncharacterized protein n=1 Tax=Trichomonascus vanleenenianus TaxID=2268995 RepID=UPI003ECB7233
MGLFRRKWIRQYEQTTFDMIDLYQFHSTSCRYVFGYFFMYLSIIISLAVYVSDVYTAVVLLAFDRWSSGVEPKVPFKISRWIFAGCIILSIVLLIYHWIVSITTMRGNIIALNYANPISRNVWSIRGYRYFCLFAKITKSRNNVEYLAFFVYFTFKGWIRLIFADSPRQVLNALTLYSVLKIDTDFVDTIKNMAHKSLTEAVVLSLMAFSLFIWVINIVQFAIALLCVCPLYVHIDKTASGLEEYIFLRVNKRIALLLEKHHKKGLVELVEQNKRLQKPTLPSVKLEEDYYYSDDQTIVGQSFEDILGANAKTTKNYIALRNQPSTDTLASDINPFEKMKYMRPSVEEERLGYGYTEPTNDSSQSLLPTRTVSNSSRSTVRTLTDNRSINAISRNASLTRSASNQSIHSVGDEANAPSRGGAGFAMPTIPQSPASHHSGISRDPSFKFSDPPPMRNNPPGRSNQYGPVPGPMRSNSPGPQNLYGPPPGPMRSNQSGPPNPYGDPRGPPPPPMNNSAMRPNYYSRASNSEAPMAVPRVRVNNTGSQRPNLFISTQPPSIPPNEDGIRNMSPIAPPAVPMPADNRIIMPMSASIGTTAPPQPSQPSQPPLISNPPRNMPHRMISAAALAHQEPTLPNLSIDSDDEGEPRGPSPAPPPSNLRREPTLPQFDIDD